MDMKRRTFFKFPLAAGALVATGGLPALVHPSVIQKSVAERFALRRLSDELPRDRDDIIVLTNDGFEHAQTSYEWYQEDDEPPRFILVLSYSGYATEPNGDMLWMYSQDYWDIIEEVTANRFDDPIEIDPTKVPPNENPII